MNSTPICDLLGIEHAIALGGMGSATSPELVAAVRAGGLGALGCRLRRERLMALGQTGPATMGQDAGLIQDIPPAGDIVRRIAQEAEEILARKLPQLLTHDSEIKGAAHVKIHH